MNSNRPVKTVLVDTGFWFGLLGKGDQHSEEAQAKLETVWNSSYVLPWPILYETLNSNFVKRPSAVTRFESFLKRPNAILLDDTQYRNVSLELVLNSARSEKRALSLVDVVIRMILDDVNVRIDGLVTFNDRDFVDVCRRRRIPIV